MKRTVNSTDQLTHLLAVFVDKEILLIVECYSV